MYVGYISRLINVLEVVREVMKMLDVFNFKECIL